jgi:sec-independent protein translocase protein TatA
MFRNPTTDLIVVLVIVLLIFGPKRLPALGKQLGSGLREFKDSITGDSKDDESEERPQIQQTGVGGATDPGGATLSRERDSAEVRSPERRA